ncbi:MAG: hypothetical protein IJQ82_00495 [Selenomonadaceae bacterium]|nr:hypothetical protein [Selenomonadaceae bacterium]
MPKDFQPTFERNGDWIKLAQMIAADGSFERAFCREFAIDKFNVHVLENFGERNDFLQWLLWLRCKLMNFGYVYRCAKKSSSPKEFVERLFDEIISCRNAKNFDELCDERREILSVMKILPPEKFFTSLLAADKILALKVFTCNSLAEKIFLFKLLQRFTFDELPTVLPILYQTFTPLAKYLSDTQIFSEDYRDYFRRYRWLKVTNTITADFFHRVEELARLKGRDFLTFDSRNKIISEEYSADAAIFLPTEWALNISISLPLTLPPSAKNFSVKYRVGFCNLPSGTVYKIGRFADATPDDEKNFPTALEFDGKIIFADYSRFTQRGSTGNEIHGGATLEEVLVPVITIQRTD